MKRNKKTKKLPKSDITNVKDVDPSKIYYKPNQYVFGLVARKKLVHIFNNFGIKSYL